MIGFKAESSSNNRNNPFPNPKKEISSIGRASVLHSAG